MTDTLTAPSTTTDQRSLPGGYAVLLGAGCALVGLLPWLATGARLPLQNLWAEEVLPATMPRALLPFSQYEVVTIVGLLLTGAVAAGIVTRAVRVRRPRTSAAAVLAGLLVVQLVAVVQTAKVVHAGLSERRLAQVYLAALVAGSLASVAVGVLVFWLLARAPRGGALLGLGIVVVPFASWLSQLLVPDVNAAGPTMLTLLRWLRWTPAVLLGAAIAWAGLRTVGRVVSALAGLLFLWLGPAVVTGVSNATGSRALLHEPTELVAYSVAVFVAALTSVPVALPPLVVAVVVAALGLLARELRRLRAKG